MPSGLPKAVAASRPSEGSAGSGGCRQDQSTVPPWALGGM